MQDILSNKQENERIKIEVTELYELEKKYKSVKDRYEEKKKLLLTSVKNWMYVKDCRKFKFVAQTGEMFARNNKIIEVNKITPTSVIFYPDRLEEKLSKEVCEKIIDKTYTITDMQGLAKYLKSCGVDPKKFKSFIEVNKTVDVKELEQLESIGEIMMEDLKGCYDTETKNSYLKMKIVEGEN